MQYVVITVVCQHRENRKNYLKIFLARKTIRKIQGIVTPSFQIYSIRGGWRPCY
jgi:hypothetical protein